MNPNVEHIFRNRGYSENRKQKALIFFYEVLIQDLNPHNTI